MPSSQYITLRQIVQSDCRIISKAFDAQGWDKPEELYQKYCELQESGKRDIIIAEWGGKFAGYLTIQWKSLYAGFSKRGIPEIVDLNVLKKYQRRGVATALMNEAEERIRRVSSSCGIRVGVTRDYGPAQILYASRGYRPDGKGLIRGSASLMFGENVVIDDSLVLCLVKKL